MKKKNITIIIIFVVIGIAILSIITWFGIKFISDMKQEGILKEEIEKIFNLDIAKDSIDMEIKSEDEYAKLEKTIKDFFNEYSITLQETLDMMEDEKLISLLSIKNYKEDGPDFEASINYISDTREKLNSNIIKLSELSTKDNIEKLIQGKELDTYYIDLYNHLMIGNSANKEFEDAKLDLEKAKENINTLLDTSENVFKFLSDNRYKWEIDSSNKVIFRTSSLASEYNKILEPITSMID